MSSSQRTRTFVVVGASSGLGRAAARELAREHRVIVAGRDVERTKAAVPGAECVRVDLADLADVARLCKELPGGIDGLVCNAGVQSAKAIRLTRDGYEETFAVNHLAHFAIATRVEARRVVFVASGTHDPSEPWARRLGFRGGRYTDARSLAKGDGDPAVDDAQRGRDRYATSKLCNLLAVDALVRRGVDAYAFDPGLMPGTGLARDHGLASRIGWHALRPAALVLPGLSSARRSGRALAWLAAEYTGDARYLDYRRRAIASTPEARRTDLADELYEASVALIAARC